LHAGTPPAASNLAADVALHTGAATMSIPIEVPPGRAGIEPNLALSYNSYRGNGWIGVGWDLEMGAIQRSTKFGVDYDANDFVAVDGNSSELVPRPEWGDGYYGAKIEGAFTKYYLNPQTGGWEVTTKNGLRFLYGTNSSSRQDDPADSSRVFKWLLNKVVDTSGNYMSVHYTKYLGQIYLKKIQYTAFEGGKALLPSNSVLFHLEDGRPDQTRIYSAGFEVVNAKRLKAIEIRTLNNAFVRTYKFFYTYNISTSRSLLDNLQHDATISGSSNMAGGIALKTLSFTWQQGGDGAFNTPTTTDMTSSLTSRYAGDYNGDGKTDILCVRNKDGYAFVRFSQGDGTFITPKTTDMTSSLTSRYPGDYDGDCKTDILCVRNRDGHAFVRFSQGDGTFITPKTTDMTSSLTSRYPGDYDGDGQTDILCVRNKDGYAFVRFSQGDGTFLTPKTTDMTSSLTSRYAGDYNGDGKTDILCVRNRDGHAFVRFSQGDGTFITPKTTDMTSSLTSRYPGDYNGDGQTDILCVRNKDGYAFVRFSLGDGTFLTPKTTDMPSSLTSRYADDYNGDGQTDILCVRNSDGHAFVRFSLGDGTFITPKTTDMTSSLTSRYPGDYDGDGKTDILCVRNSDGRAYVRFSNGSIPDLLSSLTNDFDGINSIRYTPFSRYARMHLPFTLHPVSEILSDDGFEVQSATTYHYEGGMYDYHSREFRGFETVVQKSAVGTTSEVWTETEFHQDAYYKGRPKRVALIQPGDSGALLSQTTFLWRKADFNPPEHKSAFVRLLEKRTESHDGESVLVEKSYQYDDTNGNLLSQTASGPNAESITTSFRYGNFGDWLWRKTRETVEGGVSGTVRETYFEHEEGTGKLVAKEFWLKTGPNPRIEMTYDEYGNQETVTDARGNPTVTIYDSATHTYPIRITYPQTNGVSHVVENEKWDYRFGKVKITKDENDNRTYYDYDAFGRLIQVDSPDGGQVITEYYDDEFPRLVITRSLEDDSGSTIDTYQYFDGLGRQIQTIDFGEGGKSIVTRYYYDELGRNDLVEGPFFASGEGFPIEPPERYPWTQTTFDEHGRPETVENSDGVYGSVVTTYSYRGLSATVTDPDGGSKTEKKDYLGRVVQVIEHAENANYDTNYVYNVAGDLLQVVDAYNNTTTINHDSLGRKLNMTDQDMGFWEYTYDENGNLYTQTDQKQQTITFAYDKLNRIVSKRYNTSDPTVTYLYDNLNIANGRGRLYSQSNSQVTTTFNAYDPMGRVKSVSKTISGDGHEYTTRYAYDRSGKLIRTIYPDGYQVNNTFYPGSGLLEAVTGSDNERYAYNTDYEPTGKIGLMKHANGTYTRHTYDPESTRLKAIISSRTGPSSDLQNKDYQYTRAGNIKQITDNAEGINYAYTYDRLHRLKTETNTGSNDRISYSYDALGNIKSKTVGSAAMAYDYYGPRPHAVKRIRLKGTEHNYAYDNNGNMTSGPDFTDPQQVAQRTISYNADNMPRSISHTKGGKTVTTNFVYDGNGSRAGKQIAGGSTTYYIGDHFEVKGGVATKFIFAGNLRVAKITGNVTKYFHKDHLGSTAVISDAYGNAVEKADYTPFGSLRDHTGSDASSYKFTDQEFDPSSGLYNYNARLYDPIIGRFISPDPFVQAPFDPQTLNRYTYVRNNPLIYVDPSGYGFLSKLFKKAKKAVKNAVERILPIAVGVVVGLVTGQPVLGSMAAGAVAGWMDGGGEGAALGGIFGLFTGGLSAAGGLSGGISSAFCGDESPDSTVFTSVKRLFAVGLNALHAHTRRATAGSGGSAAAASVSSAVGTPNGMMYRFRYFHHGGGMPDVDVRWGEIGDGIARAAKSLYVSLMGWGIRFDRHFYQHNQRHKEFTIKAQRSIDRKYFKDQAEAMNFYNATGNWPKTALEGLTNTIAWGAASFGNAVNLMGWYAIDVAHAGFSATYQH